MRRSLKKLVVLVSAIVMMLAMSITSFASGTTTPVTAIKIVNAADNKKVSSDTLYVNGEDESVADVYHAGDRTATPEAKTYNLDITGKNATATITKNLSVTIQNRGVATAKITKTEDGKEQLVVTAKGKGKTTITVTDKGSKKSAKLTVTVKELVDTINFAAATEKDELSGKDFVRIEQKGKVNVLASTNGGASAKTIKYFAKDYKVLVDGQWIDSVNNKNKVQAVVKVDGKGNVTAIAENRSDVEMAKATIVAYSTDQKVKNGNKSTTTGVYNEITVYVYPATYAKGDIIKIENLKLTSKKLGTANAYEAQTLYSNKSDAKHTLTLVANAYKKDGNDYVAAPSQKVTYTTSNAKVATVSADGVVTAVGNGTATISAVPAYGFASPKATVKVTVKTRAEKINVAKDNLTVFIGKSVKAGAKLDKAVNSSKVLTYSSSDEAIAQVKSNGTITGVSEGVATITVKADGASKNITVEVINPVNKVTITDDEGKALDRNKVTLYKYDETVLDVELPQSVDIRTVGTAKNGDASYPANIKVSPAKATIAEVSEEWVEKNEDGEEFKVATITATGKGSTKVTATAQDGSKKAATLTVNVVRLVDSITVANSYNNTLNVVKGVPTKINATANADASKKTLTIAVAEGATLPEGVTLKSGKVTIPTGYEGGAFDLVIKANDEGKYTETLTINPVAEEVYAIKDKVDVEVVNRSSEAGVAVDNDIDVANIVMKKGSNVTLAPVFDNAVVNRTVTWKVTGKGIAVNKNGVVTAKSVTDNAAVTVTYATSKNTKETITIPVKVVQSDADYLKAINKRLTTNLKAEDRSYLGITLPNKLGDKDNALNITITKPEIVLAQQEETGLMAVIDSMVDATTDLVGVYVDNKDVYYSAERKGLKVEVSKDDEYITTVSDYSEVGGILRNELKELGYVTLEDMNGFKASVMVNDVTYSGEVGIVNTAFYKVAFALPNADMEALIDAKIAAGMEKLANEGVLDKAGIESVDYNAATNSAVVNIKDGKVTLAEVDKNREDVAAVLKDVFAGAVKADVTVTADDINESQTFDADVESLDVAINKLFNKILERVGADSEIGVFDGGKADAKVTYEFGAAEYTYDYTVNFVRTAAAVDAQVDERIELYMTDVDTKDSGLTAGYDAEANTLTVKIDKTDYDVLTLQSTGLLTAIENTLKDVAAAGEDVSATVAVDGNTTEIADLDNVTRAELVKAFGLADDTTLGDLVDDSAAVTVVYPQISGDVTLTYKVNYVLDMDKIEAAVDKTIVDAIANAKAKDKVIADATYENGAINVTFDVANDKKAKDADVVYEIFEAAIPNGQNGISAKSILIANVDKGYQKTFDVEDITKVAIGNWVLKATGTAEDANVSALAGNTLTLKVIYTKGGEEVSVIYTVTFASTVSAGTGSDAAPAAEAVEVVETDDASVEETTEEVVEETTEEAEETVEEVVEETTEVVEETTEEVVETTEITE